MRRLTWLLVALAALLASPAAQAAGITIQARDIPADLVPGGAPATLSLDLSLQCSEILLLIPLEPTITLTPALAEGLVLGGELEAAVPTDGCLAAPTAALTWLHNLTLAATKDAPGLVQLDGNMTAVLPREGQDDLTGETPLRARAAFVGAFSVEAGIPTYNATLKEGVVRIAVSNLGNAKTTAVLANEGPTGDLDGPGDLIMERKTPAEPGRTLGNYTFTPPDGKWSTATFTVTVSGHAFGASVFKVPAQTVEVTFTNNAVEKKESPGLGVLLVPLVAGLALLLRRRA